MRSVKISQEMDLGEGNVVTVETELFVESDGEAHERGDEAAVFVMEFMRGFNEGAERYTA